MKSHVIFFLLVVSVLAVLLLSASMWGQSVFPPAAAQIPVGTPVLLSEQILGAPAATVTFSSIPGKYRNLIIVGQARCDAAITDGGVGVEINGDTGSNYSWQYATFTNGNPGYGSTISGTPSNTFVAAISCANSTANYPGGFTVTFENYSGTTFYKGATSNSGLLVGALSGNTRFTAVAWWWANTAAITSIVLSPSSGNFVTGSTFDLYAQ